MRRAYYTDPLAAAWMVNNHGMKFCCVYDLDHRADDPEDDLGDVELRFNDAVFYFIGDDDQPAEDKYFIHPESIILLKPHLNDVIRSFDPDDTIGVMIVEWHEEKPGISKRILNGTHYICERDNKPFFWPQFEEAA